VGGWISDRLGFRPMLVAAIAGMAAAFGALPFAPSAAWLAAFYSVAIAFQAIGGAMVSGILATEMPPERRSATLNLIYLPLYLGGIAGPALGAAVVGSGLRSVFYVAAAILACGALAAVAFTRRQPGKRPVPAGPAPAASGLAD